MRMVLEGAPSMMNVVNLTINRIQSQQTEIISLSCMAYSNIIVHVCLLVH